jgi:hypothetical protein
MTELREQLAEKQKAHNKEEAEYDIAEKLFQTLYSIATLVLEATN